jgi:hypothetical protein
MMDVRIKIILIDKALTIITLQNIKEENPALSY